MSSRQFSKHSRADVRPSARGVAERPQHEPDPWHDRQGHISLLAHWTFVSSFPFMPRGLTPIGRRRPGRSGSGVRLQAGAFYLRANPNAEGDTSGIV